MKVYTCITLYTVITLTTTLFIVLLNVFGYSWVILFIFQPHCTVSDPEVSLLLSLCCCHFFSSFHNLKNFFKFFYFFNVLLAPCQPATFLPQQVAFHRVLKDLFFLLDWYYLIHIPKISSSFSLTNTSRPPISKF